MKNFTYLLAVISLAVAGCSKEPAAEAAKLEKANAAEVEARMANPEYRAQLAALEKQTGRLCAELAKYEGKTDEASMREVESINRRLADLQVQAREIVRREISK